MANPQIINVSVSVFVLSNLKKALASYVIVQSSEKKAKPIGFNMQYRTMR